MYLVSIMYPHQDGARFDLDYYLKTHMKLVEKAMKPFGLKKWAVEKGLPAANGKPSPYVCIGQLFFDSADGYDRAIAAKGTELRGDLPNYTDIAPVRQVSELVA